jgi:capsular polysaccharide biosynthesis protein
MADDCYIRVLRSETITRVPPVSLDESDAARFRNGSRKYQNGNRIAIPEVGLACFDAAKIEGRSFLVLTRTNQIVLQSALGDQQILEKSGLLDRVIPRRAKKLSGGYALLAHAWADGYYHWVLEVLPKLSLLERFDGLNSVGLIVPQRLKSFQRESLLLAGIPADRIVQFDEDRWEVERLYFPDMLAPSGNPSPHAVAWLRKTFLPQGSSERVHRRRKVYVSRGDAPGRRIINEDEIVRFLTTIGFEVVRPGDHSFADQIEIFRSVDIVVAPHGAGLTNMVFAPAGTTLIEMFGDNYINGCYWALANICGHRHAFITAPTATLDYSIPLDRLQGLLAKIGEM